MKLATIALALAFALSSTFALAYTNQRSGHRSGVGTQHGTVGMSSARTHRAFPNYGNPNGSAGGPTSLSGVGSSRRGGN